MVKLKVLIKFWQKNVTVYYSICEIYILKWWIDILRRRHRHSLHHITSYAQNNIYIHICKNMYTGKKLLVSTVQPQISYLTRYLIIYFNAIQKAIDKTYIWRIKIMSPAIFYIEFWAYFVTRLIRKTSFMSLLYEIS